MTSWEYPGVNCIVLRRFRDIVPARSVSGAHGNKNLLVPLKVTRGWRLGDEVRPGGVVSRHFHDLIAGLELTPRKAFGAWLHLLIEPPDRILRPGSIPSGSAFAAIETAPLPSFPGSADAG
jgi:hypothetical protein